MKVLFVGGSGVISSATTALAIERGIDLWLLNRGNRGVPAGYQAITGDINQPENIRHVLDGHNWDAVVQWIAFSPQQIERDIGLFAGRTKQYIFISSASVYQKPARSHIITESTPLVNPFWDYSRSKIACEERLLRELREREFPAVIVRPSLTYGDTLVPLVIDSWNKSWTAVDRMRRGLPVIVPGDGNSLWTITHNSDFAIGLTGLLGLEKSIGHAFHITSDEVLTWNEIYHQTAAAAGVADPKLCHVASDFITACLPGEAGSLYGDKAVSSIFDNSKIRSFVPDFHPGVRYAEGIKRTVAWFDADPRRQTIDEEANARWDHLIAAYERGLHAAVSEFGSENGKSN